MVFRGFFAILLSLIPLYSVDIAALRTIFERSVFLEPLYDLRFGSQIHAICKGRTRSCYEIQRDFLMDEIPIWSDKSLRYNYAQRTHRLDYTPAYWTRAQKKLRPYRRYFASDQYLTLVDLKRQILLVLFWEEATHTFHYLGMDAISGGAIERERETKPREDHYLKTPTGIFALKKAWRSSGEILKDGVTMPYGQKGRFVYYFGKHKSIRYNTFDREGNKITDSKKWPLITDYLEFAIHAHQSTTPLGVAASHGCIRIGDRLNRYLEEEWVFFSPLLVRGKWIQRFTAPPPPSPRQALMGKYLIVVDAI